MNKTARLHYILMAMVTTLLLSNAACSKVGFGTNVKDNGDGSIAAAVPPGGNPPPDTTPAANLPKIQFISPACKPQTVCEIEFRLDKPYAQTTELSWKTNDTIYQTDPSHSPPYGEPNKHYIPTSGHTVWQPGETSKKVYVQNINPDSFDIIIGILISDCSFAGASEACSKFFL